MRYWNPRRAAAVRIAIDAQLTFGKEEFDRVVEGLSGAPTVDDAVAAFDKNLGDLGGGDLLGRLTGLRESNSSIFKLVVEEISKSQGTAPRRSDRR